MKNGIVGAGNIGGALTRHFRVTGHEVTIGNSRGPESLADLSAETGARAAVIESDPSIVALPVVTSMIVLPCHVGSAFATFGRASKRTAKKTMSAFTASASGLETVAGPIAAGNPSGQ